MALDLYADELVPESTARPSTGNKWLGPVLMCLLVAFGAWFYVSRNAKPDVDPSPEPTPTPAVSGLHVLIVEETDPTERAKLTPAQVAIISRGDDLEDWYQANCAKEDGFRAYRCFDKDTKLEQENQVWCDMRAMVTLEPPCVLAVDGKRAVQFKLPADPAAMKATLEKFKRGK